MSKKEEDIQKEDIQEEDVEVEIPKRLRENLYDRIHVSVKTMDIIIVILIILLMIALVFGIILQ